MVVGGGVGKGVDRKRFVRGKGTLVSLSWQVMSSSRLQGLVTSTVCTPDIRATPGRDRRRNTNTDGLARSLECSSLHLHLAFASRILLGSDTCFYVFVRNGLFLRWLRFFGFFSIQPAFARSRTSYVRRVSDVVYAKAADNRTQMPKRRRGD